MRKILISFGIICVLFLTACLKPLEDDIEEEPIAYRHTLQTSNFESFYEVEYILTSLDEGAYTVRLKVEPKSTFTVTNLDVDFKITVTEKFGAVEVLEVFDYDTTVITKLDTQFQIEPNPLRKSAYISSFELSVTSGMIETLHTIQVETKTYPIHFDAPNQSLIVIEDPVKNHENYVAFSALMEQLNQVDSNFVTVEKTETLQMKSGFESDSQQSHIITKVVNEPFGITIEDTGTTITMYKSNIDDGYIIFASNPFSQIDGKMVIEPSLISNEDFLMILGDYGGVLVPDYSEDYIYNPDKMLFATMTNGFSVKSHIKDFVPADAYQELVNLYAGLGLDTDILENTLVEMMFSHKNGIYTIVIDMVFEFKEPIEQTIRSTISVTMDFESFTIAKMTDESFIIIPPDSLEDVFMETDPFEATYVPTSPDSHYFMVSLDEGQYMMHIDTAYVDIEILDNLGNPADVGITYGVDTTWRFKDIFYVKEKGLYYFKMSSIYYPDSYTFYIEQLTPTVTIDNKTPLALGENTIIIDGSYDLKQYTFDAEEAMVLEVTGVMSDLYYIQKESWYPDTYRNRFLYEFNTDTAYLVLHKGENSFYFNSENALSTTIQVSEYGPLHHKTKDIETMASIEDEYLDSPVLLGDGLGYSYLKLDAKYAVYDFSMISNLAIHYTGVVIYDALTDERVQTLYTDKDGKAKIVLDAGLYYIEMAANVRLEFNIKVEETLIENQIIEEVLDSVDNIQIESSEFPKVSGMLINENHEPRHRFTIDNQQTILVSILDFGHKLYDIDGNLLTFSHINYNFTRSVYTLLPGTYDMVFFKKSVSPFTFEPYSIGLAIVDNPPVQDTYHVVEPAIFDPQNSSMSFTTDHTYDYEVIQLTVDAQVTYRISANKSIHIYDVNLNRINDIYSNIPVTFSPGIYYLVSALNPIGDLNISLQLQ